MNTESVMQHNESMDACKKYGYNQLFFNVGLLCLILIVLFYKGLDNFITKLI